MSGGDGQAFAQTPAAPYYAVIFTSLRTATDDGYGDTAERMVDLARTQPGFLGVESARGADGLGITVSYWESEAAILAWKRQGEHSLARARGRADWYSAFEVRIARVERAYGFSREGEPG
ncbi:antibiotic biosynthesis monooxygenase family protein [Pseudomonas solani]|uniref:antibiotic biosynthesis monooxygenase family protein n=1 Tax=Pseudomonas solani TaxID=2731552 RepID=UPI003D6C372C